MEITADEVDSIEEVRQLTERLVGYAKENPDGPLDAANLVVLHEQLEALHQAMSMVVAKKQSEGIGSSGGDDDG